MRTVMLMALAAAALAPAGARAQDEAAGMLSRARQGLTLTRRDRELASKYLREWRESEALSSEPGDQSLGRALESMALGRSFAPDEAAAIERAEQAYRRARAESRAAPGAAPGGAPAGRDRGGTTRGRGAGRISGEYLIVAAAGAVVLAAGALWILAAKRRSRG